MYKNKDITFGGVAVLVIAFVFTFVIVQMAFEKFGVTDPFFHIFVDALIATGVVIYFIKSDN